jgi:tetratricopeptide (TPR) repeat protein
MPDEQNKQIGENLKLAEAAMAEQNWPEAAQRWEAVIGVMSEEAVSTGIWVRLVRSYKHQGRLDEAEVVIKRGLSYHPDHSGLNSEFAEIAMAKENWEEAAKRWETVVESFGDEETVYPAIWMRLARAYKHQGRLDEAEVVIKRGLSYHPDHSGLNSEFAEIAMAKENWEEAAKRWETVVESSDEEAVPVSTWTRWAQTYKNIPQVDNAEAVLKRGLEQHPDHPDLVTECTELTTTRQDWQEAAKWWQKTVDLSEKELDKQHKERFTLSVVRRLADVETYKKQINDYQHRKRKNNTPRVAVYTAITGNYDSLKLPEYLGSRFDYIVYTDSKLSDAGIFDIRPLPYSHGDKTRSARYVKTHPHTLLKEYDIAVWVDANITIIDDVYPIIQHFMDSNKAIGAVPHPQRQTVYEELGACIELGKDEEYAMREQIEKYKQENFDGKDLIESNFMLFDLNNEQIPDFLDFWWSEIENHSKRDQLSLPYAIFKKNMNRYYITERPDSIRNHPSFVLTPHNADNSLLQLLNKELKSS